MSFEKLAWTMIVALGMVTGCGDDADDGSMADDMGGIGIDMGADTDGGAGDDMGAMAPAVPESCTDDGSCAYVLDLLEVPAEMAGRIAGFDVDGTSETICEFDDFEGGVDNNFSEIAPLLGAFPPMIPINMLLSDAIVNGTALVVVGLEGADGATPELSVFSGVAPEGGVMTGEDGFVAPGQTFDVEPAVSTTASLVDGVVDGGPLTVVVNVPIGGGEPAAIQIEEARVQFGFDADGNITGGVIGGFLDLSVLLVIVAELLEIECTVEEIEAGDCDNPALNLLAGFTDIDTDGDTAECEAISVGLIFTGVPATIGETVSPG